MHRRLLLPDFPSAPGSPGAAGSSAPSNRNPIKIYDIRRKNRRPQKRHRETRSWFCQQNIRRDRCRVRSLVWLTDELSAISRSHGSRSRLRRQTELRTRLILTHHPQLNRTLLKYMKQTTIVIEIEEDICGVNFIPHLPKNSHNQLPSEYHTRLWQEIASRKSDPQPKWAAVHVEETGDTYNEFLQRMSERIVRLSENRPSCKTKVRKIHTPSGGFHKVVVTTFWDQKKQQQDSDPVGMWTLREMRGSKCTRILDDQIRATLHCDGDVLYSHLPDGDVPERYEIEADSGDVSVFAATQSAAEKNVWWRFTFRRTR